VALERGYDACVEIWDRPFSDASRDGTAPEGGFGLHSYARVSIVREPPMNARPGVTLLVLTLNEIVGMKAIMPTIDRTLFTQILVVDGGSKDGTVEWARENGFEVHVQRQKGIRFAYFEVLPLVRGDYILSFSPDGNCPVESLKRLIDKMGEGFDLVIGSRYLGPARSDDDDLVTGFGNWLFTRTVNLLHRGRYTDAMTILRIYRKDLVYRLGLEKDGAYELPEKLFSTRISWEPLMAVRAAKSGMNIGEIPVDEPARIGGERKLQILRWGAAYYFQFWWEWLKKRY
jgi:glycosyltransferase involved in cell wall biosynthesis